MKHLRWYMTLWRVNDNETSNAQVTPSHILSCFIQSPEKKKKNRGIRDEYANYIDFSIRAAYKPGFRQFPVVHEPHRSRSHPVMPAQAWYWPHIGKVNAA